jgi:ribosomal protein S19
MKKIIDLINPETINNTIKVASGYKFEVSDIKDDIITGHVLFDDFKFNIQWKANGFPVLMKSEREYYHLRLVEKKL